MSPAANDHSDVRTIDGRGLRSTRAAARLEAAGRLASSPARAAEHRALLAERLDDDDPAVREVAVVALGGIEPPAVEDLRRATRRGQPIAVRLRAASMLARIGPDAAPAGDVLAACLAGSDEMLRRQASIALGTIGGASTPHIVRVLDLVDAPAMQVAALDALAMIGPDAAAALPAIEARVDHADHDTATAARAARASVDAEHAESHVAALAADLEHDDPAVRRATVERLGRLRTAAASTGEGLVQRLADADPRVRAAAALAVAQVETESTRAVPALEAARRDPVDDVRRNATAALSRYETEAAPNA